jgi:hypothetical protein
MSASGQEPTFPAGQAMSAQPLEADIVSLDGHLGYGPEPDIGKAIRTSALRRVAARKP